MHELHLMLDKGFISHNSHDIILDINEKILKMI